MSLFTGNDSTVELSIESPHAYSLETGELAHLESTSISLPFSVLLTDVVPDILTNPNVYFLSFFKATKMEEWERTSTPNCS